MAIIVAVILAAFFWSKSRSLTTGQTLLDAAAPQIAFLAGGELVVYDHATGKFSQLTQTDGRTILQVDKEQLWVISN